MMVATSLQYHIGKNTADDPQHDILFCPTLCANIDADCKCGSTVRTGAIPDDDDDLRVEP